MAKYKAVKKKSSEPTPPQIRPGLPCLVIVIGALVVVMIVMYLVMRST